MFSVLSVVARSVFLRPGSVAAAELPVRMKIYTRTGDGGTSALFTGERRSKDDIIFESLGATDELSSHVGLARSLLPAAHPPGLSEQLLEIQCRLQDLGSVIATPDLAVRTRARCIFI